MCSNEIGNYTVLLDAEKECSENPSCTGLYDFECNGGPFFTCSGNLKPSQNDSCAWKKGIKLIPSGLSFNHSRIFRYQDSLQPHI